MVKLKNNDDLITEDEVDEVPYVEFDISVSPSDPTLELLSNQITRGDIIIPFYQRRYVWKIEQASRLIESFLMGLPVPQVFLYVNNEGFLEVIDGQQRLMSVKYFFDGYFGEEDNRGKRHVFKLKGLADRSEYNGRTFAELSSRDQRKLRNSTLRAINIKQINPGTGNDSVFHIFERLNTGGTQLKPQEIRNAVYRGSIVDALKKLNDLPAWQGILGLKKPDKNQRDVELVLRLFSLFESWRAYEKPMLRHLNNFMAANREAGTDIFRKFKERFEFTVKLIDQSLDKPFRPKGVINLAVLEAVMIAVLEDDDLNSSDIKEGYPILIENEEFKIFTTGGTTDTGILQSRIAVAKRILQHV